MAITNFGQLKAAISEWSDAGAKINAKLEDFVTMTTDGFNYGTDGIEPLRVREMMAIASLTPVSGACTLPADYLEYRRVVEKAGTRRELRYIAPSVADERYPSRPGGLANDFTIIGNSLSMYPVSSNAIELTYYQKIPALSDAAPTNWLLTSHPTLYLHGGLMQLGIYRRDDDLVSRSAQFIASYAAGIRKTGERAEFARAGVRLRIAP